MTDPAAARKGRRPLVLVGFMASGKSTVGRLVADRAGLRFLDLDRIVPREVA